MTTDRCPAARPDADRIRRAADLEQMHADYEAMDQAEYEAFMDELDRDARD
ncbi:MULTISPECIES: hypothetical protein [Streptomyces]|uniref:hypothetical protein n=1 Tax=Streptomyces TaxID=1883 RepID=UPI0035EF3315